ncbi:MAG TPA: amidohydrolase family protein [Reyranella sp.]
MIRLPDLARLGPSYALHVDVVMTPSGPLRDAVVRIESGRFAEIAAAGAYANPAVPVVRIRGAALVPGMLDIHHHIIEPFAKALTGGEPAQLWKRFWMPLEAAATPQSVYAGSKWTFLEALRGGITTIVDHGIRGRELTAAIHRAAADTGIRLVSSTGAYDLKNYATSVRTPDASASVDAGLKAARDHVEDCKAFDRIYPSLACGTVQSNSKDMIKALAQFCRDEDILFQIHANEHTLEVHASIESFGRRPIELLHDIGALGRHTLIAHATLAASHEIQMLKETDTAVAYCPVASMWKGNAVAPVLDFFANGIRVGLGSDATRNDGFRMLDAAEAAQRIAYGMPRDDFSCGAGWRWFDAATLGGASVALLDREVGAVKQGLKADFLLLDCTGPEVLPSWDFAWELVRFYDRADIAATFVDGELLMQGGRATRFDSEAFVEEELAPGVQAIKDANLWRLHGESELYRKP